ncbi:hypothetical protein [Paraburkholderia solisilvae]|uniref:hypothetical protein n=1 Tax=Paraburkholderia solisilvae TaxID=624376 RepID=UPI001FE311B2|nr:hypothetical protein [Paraburkholderia solisilvae]
MRHGVGVCPIALDSPRFALAVPVAVSSTATNIPLTRLNTSRYVLLFIFFVRPAKSLAADLLRKRDQEQSTIVNLPIEYDGFAGLEVFYQAISCDAH